MTLVELDYLLPQITIGYRGKQDCISCAQSVIDLLGRGEIYGLPTNFEPYRNDGSIRIEKYEGSGAVDSHYFAVIDNHLLADLWLGQSWDLNIPEHHEIIVDQYGPPESWEKLSPEDRTAHFTDYNER